MKTDTPGFLDVKLTVVTKDPAPWLEGLAALGEVESEETQRRLADPPRQDQRRRCAT